MRVASILSRPRESRVYAEFLAPERLPDGCEPEDRFVQGGISWERYLAFDQALGDDRPGPRFYYLDEELEIMTTSNAHERIKKWLSDFIGDYLFEAGLEIATRGQATMRSVLKKAGAQLDESWCVGQESEFPNLVLEIALSSGGVRKLELYRRFAVAEVLFWRRGKLEFHALREDGSAYDELPAQSRLLPGLDRALLERCVATRPGKKRARRFARGWSGVGPESPQSSGFARS